MSLSIRALCVVRPMSWSEPILLRLAYAYAYAYAYEQAGRVRRPPTYRQPDIGF